jgi:putative molybdopterin biosynthesis protein
MGIPVCLDGRHLDPGTAGIGYSPVCGANPPDRDGHELDVFLTTDPASIERTLIFSGTLDPALEELGITAHDQGMFIHAVNTGNTGALIALKRHSCHAAPMNLPASPVLPECPFILPHLSTMDLVFVHIAMIQQGIASQDHITLEDLTSVRYINTRKDSSTRMAFDQLLESRGIDSSRVDGYHHEVANLSMVAAAIRNGHADAGMCTSGIAKANGLQFMPLAREQYELVMHREMLADPRICSLISLINSPAYRSWLDHSGAYDTSMTGKLRGISGNKTECEIILENNSVVLS